MKPLFFITSCILLSVNTACSHAVRIVTVPPGAEVSVNHKPLGTSPVLYKERSGFFGKKALIQAKWKDGQKAQSVESVKICPTPANLLMDSIFVGLFYGFCLKDEYVLEPTIQGRS